MKAGANPLAATVLAAALLTIPTAVPAASGLNVAELAEASSLAGALISTIGALPAGSSESDYEGQLAFIIEQAGDVPAVVMPAIDQAMARPGLPRAAVTALKVLLNQAREGHVKTTGAVGDTVIALGALFDRSGSSLKFTSQGGSDYSR